MTMAAHPPVMAPLKVTVVLGTRPEAVKLSPLVLALDADRRILTRVLHTGQHRELASDVLDTFGIEPDTTLDLLRPGQGLVALLARAVESIGAELEADPPDTVVVQGDTTTAAGAALAAAQLALPVAHLEAGLRSGNRMAPFPEEDNRRIISAVADLHLAPTPAARDNLLAEGVEPTRVVVTGNTGIDALDHVVATPPVDDPVVARVLAHDGPVVLLTTHRRESWGQGIINIARAVRAVADTEDDVLVVAPLHPNPTVRDEFGSVLSGHPRVILCEPLSYGGLAHVLAASTLALTDSGGIQEEAPRLGVPTLVLRTRTERPEGVAAGAARLVGVETPAIIEEVRRVLHNPGVRRSMARPRDLYGDGRAAQRAVAAIAHRHGLGETPHEFEPDPLGRRPGSRSDTVSHAGGPR